jgi:hypothetical protein
MTPARAQTEVGALLREWRALRRVTQLELAALDLVLSGHEPYPAVAVDRAWNMVGFNAAMLSLFEAVEIAPELLEPSVNVIRVGLHPRGLAPSFINYGAWHAHWLRQLERQLATTGDDRLAALIEEIAGYHVPEQDAASETVADELFGPVRVRAPDGGELAFFGMFATFDTPFEVTTSELAIELLFPADQTTAARLLDRAPRAASG